MSAAGIGWELRKALARLPPPEAPPGRAPWRSIARPEQLAPTGAWFIWLCQCGRGWGKLAAVETPVPTPKGWATLGNLRPGDSVIDADGLPTTVEAVYDDWPERAWRLLFSDGESLTVGGEHLWTAHDHVRRKRHNRAKGGAWESGWWQTARTVDTDHIAATQVYGKRQYREWSIPNAMPLQLAERDLPIEPWLLGYWLGDGDSNDTALTVGQEDFPWVASRLDEIGAKWSLWNVARLPLFEARRLGLLGLRPTFRAAGLLGSKHVPESYLWSSTGQRLALLRGLMDSDGYAERSKVEFSSTLQCLAEAVLQLARSLGECPRISESRAKLRGRDTGPKWRVSWRPARFIPFLLPRKARRVRLPESQVTRTCQRMIVSADPVTIQPMRCITVSSPSSLFLLGRGMIPTHNTRTGAEWVREKVESGAAKHVALVAPTAADARDVMIGDDQNAESGLLQVCYPRPEYEPSKRRVTWPNGATAVAYSADQPERLRGPQHDLAWADEVDAWGYRGKSSSPDKARSAWSNLLLGLRLGDPQVVVTSTPKPGRIITEIRKMEDHRPGSVAVITGSTYDNRDNLAAAFFDTVVSSYDGTRLGRQEIGGELLADVEGALWTQALIDAARARKSDGGGWLVPGEDGQWFPAPSDFQRIVIPVDPAVTSRASSDETGIVPCASSSPNFYVLGDHSDRLSPSHWAKRAVGLYEKLAADLVVGEVNNGGDLVERNLRTVPGGDAIRYQAVRASRGKAVRAEPVVGLYEQGRVFHLCNCPRLEDEMTTWVPDSGDPSPSRLDALVWGLTELLGIGAPPSVYGDLVIQDGRIISGGGQ